MPGIPTRAEAGALLVMPHLAPAARRSLSWVYRGLLPENNYAANPRRVRDPPAEKQLYVHCEFHQPATPRRAHHLAHEFGLLLGG